MLFIFFRRLFLIIITLIILSMISYYILLKDPLNQVVYNEGFSSYLSYIKGIFIGDLGISYNTGELLLEQILRVFPATLSLCFATTLLSLIIGIPLGFISAYNLKNPIGKILHILGSLSLAIPVFWLAIVMLYYAATNHWEIASVGEINAIYDIPKVTNFKFIDMFLVDIPYQLKVTQHLAHHLALSTIILGIPATLEVMRMTQEQVQIVMQKNYVQLAKIKGWSAFKIWRRHIVCNTLPPIIPAVTRNIILIFAFSMLVENVVSWGGIGHWLVKAVEMQDYNAISAGVIVIGLFILIIDVLANIITSLLDPSNKKEWYVK